MDPSSDMDDVIDEDFNDQNILDQPDIKISLHEKGSRKSEAWSFFGQLCKNSKLIDKNHVYCHECFKDRRITRYKTTVSTGNLISHVTTVHEVDLNQQNKAKKNKLMSNFFAKKTKPNDNINTKRFMLSRQIATMCAVDLLPFSLVDKPGFQNFCKKYDIIAENEKLPHHTTIERSALNDIYVSLKNKFDEMLRKNKIQKAAVTFDGWTDNYRHLSYITLTLHFIDDNFQNVSVNISTEIFPQAGTGANLATKITTILKKFKIEKKVCVAVTDNGANMIKCCKLMKITRIPCLAHGLHNLITKDLLENGPKENKDLNVFPNLLAKMRDAHRALLYKYAEMQDKFDEEKDKKIIDVITNHQHIESILETETYDTNEEGKESEDHSYFNNPLDILNLKFTKLKRDVPTRWNSIFMMLESFVKSYENIKRVHEKTKTYDKILTEEDFDLSRNLLDFLSVFKNVTESLSGSQYSTLDMVAAFKISILERLSKLGAEDELLMELSKIVKASFEKRFPLTDEHVCAAILSPSMKHLDIVDEYLDKQELTKEMFLEKMVAKYVDDENKEQGHYVRVEKKSIDSEKKALVEILKEHSKPPCSSFSTEIREYLLHSTEESFLDTLLWWKNNGQMFPTLKKLAKAILCIPATSAPSERAFSYAGLALTAKRSRLEPSKVNKMLFVHDNYSLLAPKE